MGLGARARAASLDHLQTSLDIHPSLVVWGLERKETKICGWFVVFFKGFWVCLLLISLKSQILGRVPWLTEK